MNDLDDMIAEIEKDTSKVYSAVLDYMGKYPSQEADIRNASYALGEDEMEEACSQAISAGKRLVIMYDPDSDELDPVPSWRLA